MKSCHLQMYCIKMKYLMYFEKIDCFCFNILNQRYFDINIYNNYEIQ